MVSTYHDLIQFVDLTNLSNNLDQKMLAELCEKCHSEAYKVAALCIEKEYVKFCKEYLSSKNIAVASVFNFPNGDQDLDEILNDISNSISDGVDELDIVIPMGKLKDTNDLNHFKDIIITFATQIRNFVPNHILKFIISTDLLIEPSLIQAATEAIILSKGDFVKTCTGKNGSGVTLDALDTIINTINAMNSPIGVKASGGVKDYKFAGEIYNAVNEAYTTELTPKQFRIGASSLLDDLLSHGQERLDAE